MVRVWVIEHAGQQLGVHPEEGMRISKELGQESLGIAHGRAELGENPEDCKQGVV